jgi:adenine-specific DNA methylase
MDVFRPIHYLGNKLRVLHEICEAVAEITPAGGRIADLFAGSTVVSQALANRGYSLTAVDSQAYAVVLAKAFLSVDRREGESLSPEDILDHSLAMFPTTTTQWDEYAAKEDSYLADRDPHGLLELYEQLPLVWRDAGSPHFHAVSTSENPQDPIPIMTSVYAGSYFGVRQALELDRIRQAIADLHKAGSVSTWQVNAALASLLCAASEQVHSAGKHFAQPLTAGKRANQSFRNSRLLRDRSIDTRCVFRRCAAALNAVGRRNGSNHDAMLDTAEAFASSTRGRDFDVYYLDPPYTAQQYSRFYHVLETLSTFVPPKIRHDGVVTAGLYPSKRFKSAFSSRVNALPALRGIVAQARSRGIRLLISYSHSRAGSNGNSRMIALDDLLQICRHEYGRVNVRSWSFSHRYRQFNNQKNANGARNDPEVLVSCRIG